MKITTIHSGLFKLDGGAMFGVVPKQMWKKLNTPDDNNMCTWSMRCLLLEWDDRKMLIDTGMGDKQGDKFRSHFEPHGPYSLNASLEEAGLKADDITDVFLTHLHFDHVGGAVSKEEDGRLSPTFTNATYWSNKAHWEWARTPNPRERASFLKENFIPLEEQGVVQHLPDDAEVLNWIPQMDVLFVNGHTEKMMVPLIKYQDKTIAFCADLLPSAGHVGLPYVMSYDIRPLFTMKEKKSFLDKAVEGEWILFLEHDHRCPCITIELNDRGRYAVKKRGSLKEFL